MIRWNWFLAADNAGRWAISQGRAEMEMDDLTFAAELYLGGAAEEGARPHYIVTANIEEEGSINAVISSPGRAADFELNGQMFQAEDIDDVDSATILLTDGSTVLGLSFGPDSDAEQH
jgi:hypothetical protein